MQQLEHSLTNLFCRPRRCNISPIPKSERCSIVCCILSVNQHSLMATLMQHLMHTSSALSCIHSLPSIVTLQHITPRLRVHFKLPSVIGLIQLYRWLYLSYFLLYVIKINSCYYIRFRNTPKIKGHNLSKNKPL
jgi:hypothetical protein